jgi:peptidoglycan/LPS O-acetylase OafA/YrhL
MQFKNSVPYSLYVMFLFQAVHNKLMEEYGMPTWGSYLIFAVATIIIGALLGLVSFLCIEEKSGIDGSSTCY